MFMKTPGLSNGMLIGSIVAAYAVITVYEDYQDNPGPDIDWIIESFTP